MPTVPIFVVRDDTLTGTETLGLEGETPDIYASLALAQREIAEYQIDLLREVVSGHRDLDEADCTWYVAEATFDPSAGVVIFEDDSRELLSPGAIAYLRAEQPSLFSDDSPRAINATSDLLVIHGPTAPSDPDDLLRTVLHAAGIPYSEAPIGQIPRFSVGSSRTGGVEFSMLMDEPSGIQRHRFCGVRLEQYHAADTGGDCVEARVQPFDIRFETVSVGSIDSYTLDLKALRIEFATAFAAIVTRNASRRARLVREFPVTHTAQQSHADAIRADVEQRAVPVMHQCLGAILTAAQTHDPKTGFFKNPDPYEIAALARKGYTALTIGPEGTCYARPNGLPLAEPTGFADRGQKRPAVGAVIRDIARLEDDRVTSSYDAVRNDSLGSDRPEDLA